MMQIAEDGDGRILSVGTCESDHVVLHVRDSDEGGGVCIEPGVIDRVWRCMRQAAGLDMPVVLGRPPVDHVRGTHLGPLQVWERDDGKIGVGILPGGEVHVEPQLIRQFAAAAVAHADHLEAGPDPALVAEVAEVMERAESEFGTHWDIVLAVAKYIQGREADRG